MRKFIYRLKAEPESERPQNVDEARGRLLKRNAEFAELVNGRGPTRTLTRDDDLGRSRKPTPQKQTPFAAVLGCADARVPAELVFAEGANDLFLLRVAGNVLAEECMGSLDYAAVNFASLKVAVVLGHTECGAVGAAVTAYTHPDDYLATAPTHGLRALVNRIMVAVRLADNILRNRHPAVASDPDRYHAALTCLTAPVNAALVAATIREEFENRLKLPDKRTPPKVMFGVYDLVSKLVGLPTIPAGAAESAGPARARKPKAAQIPWQPDLRAAPADDRAITTMAEGWADAIVRAIPARRG